jgi:glycosyltransferase involved in cell wall biosynthesis
MLVWWSSTRPGRSGLTVPPQDPRALRERIERVLGDNELAGGLGRVAREDVERRLTTRHLAERLAPFLQEAAGG